MTERDRTVVMLGAGASASSRYSLPCMSGFFDSPKYARHRYPALTEVIERLYRGRWSEKKRAANLEHIMSHLEMVQEHLRGAPPAEQGAYAHVTGARRELDDFLDTRLRLPFRLLQSPDLQKQQAERAETLERYTDPLHNDLFMRHAADSSATSVITLNYDLVADASLGYLDMTTHGPFSGRVEALRGFLRQFSGDISLPSW